MCLHVQTGYNLVCTEVSVSYTVSFKDRQVWRKILGEILFIETDGAFLKSKA